MKVSGKTAVLIVAVSLLALSSVVARMHNRRYAVRPLIRKKRKMFGHFSTLVKSMREKDPQDFFRYTRMTPALFDLLLSIVEHDLKKHPCRGALSPAERLTITLHYLSEGCSMQQIAWDFYIGKSTAHYVIKETCNALWSNLQPIYLPEPTTEMWHNICKGFFQNWNMPNCLGAVDGKHVVIQAPKYSGSDYFSYKKSFSLVLMATCDAYFKFTTVDIGAAGSNHDSSVFKNSGFGQKLMNKQLSIPTPPTLPGSNIVLPYFLVADQAFPLHEDIMRPYPGERLGERKNIFNYRLSRARRTIENTFGILVQRWRILRKPIIGDISTCEEITRATVVLHNFLQRCEQDIPPNERRYCPTGFVDNIDVDSQLHYGQWRECDTTLRSVQRTGSNNSNRIVQNNRETLTEYFLSDVGCVPWQWDQVLKGSLPT